MFTSIELTNFKIVDRVSGFKIKTYLIDEISDSPASCPLDRL